jgi:hypothetical protein
MQIINVMAPIRLGNLSVEIAVNNINGFIHDVVELPPHHGFWVSFTVRDDSGKIESFPLVDGHYRIKVFATYQEAFYDAAQKIIRKKGT